MDWLGYLAQNFHLFLPVLARASTIFLTAPVFASRYLPIQVRLALGAMVALVLLPLVPPVPLPEDVWGYSLAMTAEVLVGLAIGFAVQLMFMAIQVGGEILDLEMGFGITNVIDPRLEIQLPLMGSFQYLLAILVFLTVNGHHMLLEGLLASFHAVPIGGPVLQKSLYDGLTGLFAGMFLTAVKISAPVLGSLFLTSVALGIASRAVPQMNVFVVGLSLKAALGILVFMVVLPFYLLALEGLFRGVPGVLEGVIKALATGS